MLVVTAVVSCGGLCGCAGTVTEPKTPSPLPTSLTISQQPQDQAVPIGRPATFSVNAYGGTGTLTYQWRRNGSPVAGATAATYSTPDILASDDGALFDVVVSDSSTSQTSNSAKLTAGPRAPLRGDLRYLLAEQLSGPGVNDVIPPRGSNQLIQTPNAVPTPLTMGWCAPADGCGWDFYGFSLPTGVTGLNMVADLGYYPMQGSVAADVQQIAAPNVVIMSLDVETLMNQWAAAWVQTTRGAGFDYRLEPVPMGSNLQSDLQATVAADGAQSRIVTAVTFDDADQLAYVLSYGWTGDTNTVYEAEVETVPFSGVKDAGFKVAKDGYFISAFGGNDADGYMIVGMRVQGDAMPRPIGDGTSIPTNHDSAYWTPVVAHQANLSLVEQ
ncbi:MAG: hypothetical protein ACLGSD_06520 [Acidobacteriota bacterium]